MLRLHVYDISQDRYAVVSFATCQGLKEQALAALQAGCAVRLTGQGGKRPRMDDIDSVEAFQQRLGIAVRSV